jgi:integrase
MATPTTASAEARARGPVKFTDLTVKNAKPGSARREIADANVRGLFLIVQTSGVKSWALRYRAGGRARKLTLGRYPAVDLASARKLAKVAQGQIALGRDPGAEKVAAHNAAAKTDDLGPKTHFGQVVDEYLDKHISNKRPATRRQARGLLKREFARWNKRPIGDIDRKNVNTVLDAIVDRGHRTTANRAHAFLKALFRWSIKRGIVDTSPVAGIDPPAQLEARERVLDDRELLLLWKACEELPAPYGQIVRLLVLTGARRREVSGMEWSELDLDAEVWTLPKERSKNKKAHTLPLPPQAIAILKGMPNLLGSKFVFTNEGKVPVNDFANVKRVLDSKLPAGTQRWTFHDLRRTTATGLARLGTPIHVTEAVLNHKSGTIKGIAAIYNRYDYQSEMKAALQEWADHIDKLTGANVIPLPTTA